jgi:predicted acetyltransferase
VKSGRLEPDESHSSFQFVCSTVSFKDAQVLGELNHHLIQDEGHRNPMTVQELINRMRLWLETDYRASIFEVGSSIVAYSLYREGKDHLYLRQFFVQRHKRGAGIGQQCVKILFSQVWPKDKRITVEVLCQNEIGIAFWRAVGFTDYCLTPEIYPDLRTTNASG